MQVKIKDITIEKRIRKELGDLNNLATSINKFGQMNPVLLTQSYHLIAGHRRIEASKMLGREYVEAIIIEDIDDVEKLEMEIDENLYRKALTDKELDDALEKLNRLKSPGFFARLIAKIKNFFQNLFVR
ncbi:MAG: ParB N-terminal domain-containing protein [Spirochaetales bacterium]|nr:ParB N-terminal domain-containing protein [Spirochaetales bacterium]